MKLASWMSLNPEPHTAEPVVGAGGSQIVMNEADLFVFGGHTAWTDADGTEGEKVHDDVWRLELASCQVSPAPPAPGFKIGG